MKAVIEKTVLGNVLQSLGSELQGAFRFLLVLSQDSAISKQEELILGLILNGT